MKWMIMVATAALLAGLGFFIFSPRCSESTAMEAVTSSTGVSEAVAPREAVDQEGADVFRRAFWRHPVAGDRILHATLREWSEGDEGARWQWFILVEPSSELLADLFGKNPFALVPDANPQVIAGAPEWFQNAFQSADVLKSPNGTRHLFFDRAQNRLYATASGGEFNPGASDPVRQVIRVTTSGRLPTSPPPVP